MRLVAHRRAILARISRAVQDTVRAIDQNPLVSAERSFGSHNLMPLRAQGFQCFVGDTGFDLDDSRAL